MIPAREWIFSASLDRKSISVVNRLAQVSSILEESEALFILLLAQMKMLVVDKLRQARQRVDLLKNLKVESLGIACQQIYPWKPVLSDHMGQSQTPNVLGLKVLLDVRYAVFVTEDHFAPGRCKLVGPMGQAHCCVADFVESQGLLFWTDRSMLDSNVLSIGINGSQGLNAWALGFDQNRFPSDIFD